MSAAANKAIISNFLEVIGQGDVAAIRAAYAEDGYCQTMGNTLISGKFGREQVAAAAGRIFDAFPNGVRFDVVNMTAEDDRVAVEAVSHGDHVSGAHYSNHYHFFFRLRDGKITELREFMDTELVTDILCGGQRPARTG